MPRATCRCGQKLSIPFDGPERVICPKCQAKVRVRRDAPKVGPGDGFLRFNCPCGRRLKVRAAAAGATQQLAGKCPDCGRVVPVPTGDALSSASAYPNGPETRTDELDANDVEALGRWARSMAEKRGVNAESEANADPETTVATIPEPDPATIKIEAGLRVCPQCGRPLHLSAVTCRACGSEVPKR